MTEVQAPRKRHAVSQRGRKRADNPRQRFVTMRCSRGEYTAIEEKSSRAGLSVGAFLRAQALGNAGPRSVKRPPIERRELARILGHVGKIGSNINQLAKAFNQVGRVPGFPELLAMRREIGDIRTALLKALGRGD